MDISKKDVITPFEFACIIIGSVIDTSTAAIPSIIVYGAKQDAWLSPIIAAIYPLYIVIICIYISKKYPKENILTLSRTCFGKIFGNILNVLFLITLVSYIPQSLSTAAFIFRTYIAQYTEYLKLSLVMVLVSLWTSSKNLKALGRVSIVVVYLLIFIMLMSLAVLPKGNIHNLTPLLQHGIKPAIPEAIKVVRYYIWIEVVLILYPFVEGKESISKASLGGLGFVAFFYTFVVFISIYYLGIYVIPKTSWAFFNVTDAIRISIINNFRYILIMIWIIISVKAISIIYHSCNLIIKDSISSKMGLKNYIVLGIITMIVVFVYKDLRIKEKSTQVISFIYIIYNFIYITTIAVVIHFKKGDNQ